MLEPLPERPKGMHHDTYMRLLLWTPRSDNAGGVRVVSKSPGSTPRLFHFPTICRNFRSAPGRIRTSDSRFRNPSRFVYPCSRLFEKPLI
jgi:hypothetical protein